MIRFILLVLSTAAFASKPIADSIKWRTIENLHGYRISVPENWKLSFGPDDPIGTTAEKAIQIEVEASSQPVGLKALAIDAVLLKDKSAALQSIEHHRKGATRLDDRTKFFDNLLSPEIGFIYVENIEGKFLRFNKRMICDRALVSFAADVDIKINTPEFQNIKLGGFKPPSPVREIMDSLRCK